jgi:subtilisin family serine protease
MGFTHRLIALVLLLLPVATSIASINGAAQVENNNELIRVSIGLCDCGDYGALKHMLTEALTRIPYSSVIGEMPEIRVVVVEVPRGMVEYLRRLSFIKYVEESVLFYPQGEVQWNIELINATKVWSVFSSIYGDAAYGYHSAIQVAVVDSGIDYTHPDLQGAAVYCIKSTNNTAVFYKGTNLTECIDEIYHGTGVTGVLAARLNGYGVAGVAPRVQVYTVKVATIINKTSDGVTYTYYNTDIAKGVVEAVKGPDGIIGTDDDADVVSISLGGRGSTTLYSAVMYAYNNGAVVVACAGNSGASTPEYPAGYSEVIAVGAVGSNYNVPDWSNRNPDVVAPGVDVLTTNIGGGYVYGSGTSLATPHVSGVVAIIQALRLSAGMGKLAPGDVESLLKSTAVDLGSPGYDEASGYGLVDAYNATLRALDAVVVTVTITMTTTQTVTETLVYTTTRVSTTTQATTAAATVTKTTTTTSLVTLTTTQLLTTTETATTTATQPPETTTITQTTTTTQHQTTTETVTAWETAIHTSVKTETTTERETHTTTATIARAPVETVAAGALGALIGALAAFLLTRKTQ